MKELVIISGKGGTGKTSISAAFASLASNSVICDADVDAANLHLLLDPQPFEHEDFFGGSLAVINQQQCSECGSCAELCTFQAISEALVVDPIACEGCGVCVDFCPEGAIDFPVQKCGETFFSDTRFGPMSHARLGIAEENSGKLVSVIRKKARQYAEERRASMILTDGPPGIGCPVIASITGATAVLIIVETSLASLHDLKRVNELAEHFKLPVMVCINKCDVDEQIRSSIEAFTTDKSIEIVGRIPFHHDVTRAMVEGKTILERSVDPDLEKAIRSSWSNTMRVLDRLGTPQPVQLNFITNKE